MGEAVKAPATRRYRSPLRADQARATRRRIREAADALFRERGYAGTSMDDVAVAAGVSRQTVFSAFGSKARLLKEALDVRIAGDDEPRAVLERPPAQRMLASTDAAEAIRRHARIVVASIRRTAPLWPAFVTAAGSDPEMAELARVYDEARLEGTGVIVDVVGRLGALRTGRSRRKAKEAVWLLTNPATLAAAFDRGWSPRDVERWLVGCLEGLLLEPQARP